MNEELNAIIRDNMTIKGLGKFACPYEMGERFKEEKEDFRPTFYRDIDRIIYSLAYSRYLDKTQVFTHGKNDHISRRITHVQFVSKIARTIGRALNLNEDLIEAASLGHDLGHAPFGHVGEEILNRISLKYNEGFFNHNIQSVRLLKDIENYGNGLNISIPVLDAIMCHNGEIALSTYSPVSKTREEFLKEYNDSYKSKEVIRKMRPMTLEGCVVRISDLVAYLGKDIEDAARMNIISFDDVPKDIVNILGHNNREIVNTIINDIIKNSINKNYIKLSDEVYKAVELLKDYNYKNIYYKAYTTEEKQEIEDMFNVLFDKYLSDLNNNNYESIIYKSFLSKMNDSYKKNSNARIVIDYISGMTDDYIKKQYNDIKNH